MSGGLCGTAPLASWGSVRVFWMLTLTSGLGRALGNSRACQKSACCSSCRFSSRGYAADCRHSSFASHELLSGRKGWLLAPRTTWSVRSRQHRVCDRFNHHCKCAPCSVWYLGGSISQHTSRCLFRAMIDAGEDQKRLDARRRIERSSFRLAS